MHSATHRFAVLQEGQIRERPGGRRAADAEHRCSAVLLWPEAQQPCAATTALVDPCFTETGASCGAAVLQGLGLSWGDVGAIWTTHKHGDHQPQLPRGAGADRLPDAPLDDEALPSGLRAVPCPGHSPDSTALVFRAPEHGVVWVTGDAILNEEWLRSWEVYAPWAYTAPHVKECWRSVANIVANAEFIIPGHGGPIAVTAELVADLLRRFHGAAYSEDCPDVFRALRARLQALGAA